MIRLLPFIPFAIQSQTADIYKSVTLAWDYSNLDVGFNIYVGKDTNNFNKKFNVGTNLSLILPVEANTNNFFCATAYDTFGNESDHSNIISYNPPSNFKFKTQYHLQRADGLYIRLTYVTPTNLNTHLLINTNAYNEDALTDVRNWQDLNLFATDRYTLGGVSYTSVNVPLGTNNYPIASYNDFLSFSKYNYALFYSPNLKDWTYVKPMTNSSMKGVPLEKQGFYTIQ